MSASSVGVCFRNLFLFLGLVSVGVFLPSRPLYAEAELLSRTTKTIPFFDPQFVGKDRTGLKIGGKPCVCTGDVYYELNSSGLLSYVEICSATGKLEGQTLTYSDRLCSFPKDGRCTFQGANGQAVSFVATRAGLSMNGSEPLPWEDSQKAMQLIAQSEEFAAEKSARRERKTQLLECQALEQMIKMGNASAQDLEKREACKSLSETERRSKLQTVSFVNTDNPLFKKAGEEGRGPLSHDCRYEGQNRFEVEDSSSGLTLVSTFTCNQGGYKSSGGADRKQICSLGSQLSCRQNTFMGKAEIEGNQKNPDLFQVTKDGVIMNGGQLYKWENAAWGPDVLTKIAKLARESEKERCLLGFKLFLDMRKKGRAVEDAKMDDYFAKASGECRPVLQAFCSRSDLGEDASYVQGLCKKYHFDGGEGAPVK